MHQSMGVQRRHMNFFRERIQACPRRPITSMFGSVVLCELPQSAQADDRPRFLEGAYLRPEFNSKSGLCLVMLDGVLRKIHPKSIKTCFTNEVGKVAAERVLC